MHDPKFNKLTHSRSQQNELTEGFAKTTFKVQIISTI